MANNVDEDPKSETVEAAANIEEEVKKEEEEEEDEKDAPNDDEEKDEEAKSENNDDEGIDTAEAGQDEPDARHEFSAGPTDDFASVIEKRKSLFPYQEVPEINVQEEPGDREKATTEDHEDKTEVTEEEPAPPAEHDDENEAKEPEPEKVEDEVGKIEGEEEDEERAPEDVDLAKDVDEAPAAADDEPSTEKTKAVAFLDKEEPAVEPEPAKEKDMFNAVLRTWKGRSDEKDMSNTQVLGRLAQEVDSEDEEKVQKLLVWAKKNQHKKKKNVKTDTMILREENKIKAYSNLDDLDIVIEDNVRETEKGRFEVSTPAEETFQVNHNAEECRKLSFNHR